MRIKSWSDITQGVGWMSGSAISEFCKRLKGAALHSSVFNFKTLLTIILRCNSVPLDQKLLEMQGNCPTACNKTSPWGVTGHQQSQPSSHTLTLTTFAPQTTPETWWECWQDLICHRQSRNVCVEHWKCMSFVTSTNLTPIRVSSGSVLWWVLLQCTASTLNKTGNM